ncbi:hypothetical protein FRC04_011111 [Tulasnella sp. 424]|nr:hypothetical protein FRC04_011111 [Tulasnella sp. 424]KAG8978426.1 hypothetical protein FRC05_010671 [Tulasnella sp. 425]
MAQSTSYLGVQYNWKPGATSSIASAASSRSSLHIATESNAITQRNQELRRKAFEKRDSKFVITNGARRHGLRKEVAPYPMCYNHEALDIDTIDHCALWGTRGGPSDFDFKEPPKRSLDLGCGHATWILQTAKVWKTTHFVGFDLVKDQPDLSLYPDIADRVEWVHGNFLTQPLPFPTGSFDHVYCRTIEMAVREDQWDFVISEIVRILKPGGAAEFMFNERKLLHKAPPYEPPPPPPILPGFGYPSHAAPSVHSQNPTSVSTFNANLRQQSKTLTNRARKAINNMVTQTQGITHDVNGHGKGRPHGPDDVDEDVRSASGSGVMSASTSQLSNASSGKLSISDPQAFDASDAPPVPRIPPSIITRPSMSSHREPTPPRHVHEWLEDIFYAMFERRFINVTPTRILPNYLNIHLNGVTAGQHVKMPMIKPGTIYAYMDEETEGGSTAGSTTDEEGSRRPPAPPTPPPKDTAETPTPATAVPATASEIKAKKRSSMTLYAEEVPTITPVKPPAPKSKGRARSVDSTSLKVQTNVPANGSSNPPSSSSPNIVVDEAQEAFHGDDRSQVPSSATPATLSTISSVSSPPSSFSLSQHDASSARTVFKPAGRPGTAPSGPPPSFLGLKRKPTTKPTEVTTMVFELQEHVVVGGSRAADIVVDSVATIAGRERTHSSASGSQSASRSEASLSVPPEDQKEPEPKAEKQKQTPQAPKKRKRKPLKFVAASQALTMMLVRSYKAVLACREDMFEELLLQNGIPESANGDPDHPEKSKVAALREKFDHAFDHYISDMRDVAAIGDGLVYALGMKRPAKAALTPAQEMDERVSREKRVEKTLGLIGWAYRPQSMVQLADGDRGRSGSAEHGRKSLGQVKPTPDLEEEEPCLFRSTRVYAGFKRMTFTKPSPP